MSLRFDVHIQPLPEAEQISSLKLMGFGDGPSIGVKGFQMLINIWLKNFLTPRGSDPAAPDEGTAFGHLIGSNVSPSDASDVVRLAIEDCNEQVITFQSADTTLTASERLSDARLIDFRFAEGDAGFDAYVEIKNQANERLILRLPNTPGA